MTQTCSKAPGLVPEFSHFIYSAYPSCSSCVPGAGDSTKTGPKILAQVWKGTVVPDATLSPIWQYFQGRLAGANSTAEALSTNHTSPTDSYNFNNWVTLLSQLPLLLFTLLNSFLYQW